MEIHEITKRHRTDEGLLDKVKSAVNSAKTGYNAVSNKYNAAKDKFNAAGDKWQEKQWDKAQAKRNQQTSDAAKALARKGFNVDTTTPLAKAQTPTRIKQQQQQKIAQLQQAFDQEFDLGQGQVVSTGPGDKIKAQLQAPGTTKPTSYQKVGNNKWKDEVGNIITDPATVDKLEKQVNPAYQVNPGAAEKYAKQKAAGFNPRATPIQPIQPVPPAPSAVKEGSLAQRSQARNAGVAPAQAKPTGKKDIGKEFMTWISQHIPGLANVSPEIKQQLNQIFKTMLAAKGNPAAVDKAFQQYASTALNAASRTPQGQQAQGRVSPSAQYAQGTIATQLGITPETIAKLQQRIEQNKEQINNTHTGSQTIDKLIQAVTKK